MVYLPGRHLNLPALQWDNHVPSLLYGSAPLHDSDMFIFLEFRFGCLSSPYEKYSDVCSSCSVYTFFGEVFIATPHPRCLSRSSSSTNSSRGGHFVLMIFYHPHPNIWLNSCLDHTPFAAHASIVIMTDQEILIYCGSFMKCWLCIPVFNLEFLVIMTRILLWKIVLRSLENYVS